MHSQFNTSRVLMIDDNEIDLKINSRIISLTKIFDHVETCGSGQEALSFFNKNINNPEVLPDFILLDIQMPDMDGFQFLDVYKSLPKHVIDHCVVIMLSSTLDFGDIQRAEANIHVVKLLKKPLNPDELKDLIHTYGHSQSDLPAHKK